MIELKHISIGYSAGNVVFSDLSAHFPAGRLIGLIGNNGVGKSTLIKTLCGYLSPLKGEYLIEQQSSDRYTIQKLSTLISIVLPEKITGFNLRAYDVVAAGRIPYINTFSTLSPEDARIAEESMETIGISALKHKLMEELSDGQRQKVMIAKSLAQQTPVIILDEPTAFLDYRSKHQLFDILKKLCGEQNKLVLVSSHDLDLVFAYADRVLLLEPDHQFTFDSPSVVKPKTLLP
ncbi:MAG: ABC transporter ATP-binding protein [Bacteroidetes bacterium]|nr:ABC transporter ATP-binding protein [Bacteroidota bacterium]